MSKDLTKRYVEEVFDVTGLARRGIKRLDEIRNMPENEFDAFVKDLENRFRSHYERNLGKIGEALRRQKRQSKHSIMDQRFPLLPQALIGRQRPLIRS